MISPNFFVFVVVILCFTIDLSNADDVFNDGRQKYEQIRSLSSSKTSPCWQQILTMLHEHCSLDQLDKYQGFIAYQFTLCHLSSMNEDFDSLTSCTEENIDQCVEQLHRHMNAFIAYTEFYPFVQSVCYVLREKSYQSELASRLTLFLNHSQETIHKLISSIHIQQKLTHQIHHQQSVQETILNNARQLKTLARINMDKTQDILSSVIEAARHEYDLLKQICALSQTIQTIVRITCTYSFWFYALSMFAIYLITIPKRTSQARSILFCAMFIYVLVERYCQMSSMINFYQWRSTCWIICLMIVIRFAWKYQSRAEMHHEQLSRITETLIQTEANFFRISRELKRARSKSRSRSRSMRSRRQKQGEERALSPLVVSPQRPLTVRDENKENQPRNHLIDDEEDEEMPTVAHRNKKPQYSLLLNRKSTHEFRSSKSTRILMGRTNLENNI